MNDPLPQITVIKAETFRPASSLLMSAAVDEIMTLQSLAYVPQLQETRETFETKLRIYPQGCFLIRDSIGLAGYAISHPGNYSELNAHEIDMKERKSYYFHDLAIVRPGRGIGKNAAQYVQTLAEKQGFAKISLVAVQDSAVFLERLGYASLRKIENYSSSSMPGILMEKSLR